MADRPPVPMSGKRFRNNIDETLKATHVYVKLDNPASLMPRFEGPFEITSRPSHSQVEVKVGLFKSGEPRLRVFNWNSCKVAHMRDNATENLRPALGRRQNKTADQNTNKPATESGAAKIQTYNTLSGLPPHPDYLKKGPIVTDQMYSKLPEVLRDFNNQRPVRSTRNPNPQY